MALVYNQVQFTEDEQPTMANFNEKFMKLVQLAESAQSTANTNNGKIAQGSYVGTGIVGGQTSDYKALALPFPPKLLFVWMPTDGESSQYAILTDKGGTGTSVWGSTSSASGSYAFQTKLSGNTLSWRVYTNYNQSTNFDSANVTYKYVAIG